MACHTKLPRSGGVVWRQIPLAFGTGAIEYSFSAEEIQIVFKALNLFV